MPVTTIPNFTFLHSDTKLHAVGLTKANNIFGLGRHGNVCLESVEISNFESNEQIVFLGTYRNCGWFFPHNRILLASGHQAGVGSLSKQYPLSDVSCEIWTPPHKNSNFSLSDADQLARLVSDRAILGSLNGRVVCPIFSGSANESAFGLKAKVFDIKDHQTLVGEFNSEPGLMLDVALQSDGSILMCPLNSPLISRLISYGSYQLRYDAQQYTSRVYIESSDEDVSGPVRIACSLSNEFSNGGSLLKWKDPGWRPFANGFILCGDA